MCGRSSLTKSEQEIEERFNVKFYSDDLKRYNLIPNFNVAPTHLMPVLLSGQKYFKIMRWGLVPRWNNVSNRSGMLINARVETLKDKVVFRDLLRSHRCIIPMDGFYEWKRQGKSVVPYRIVTKDQSIFGVAGLYTEWQSPSNREVIKSFTIITLEANELVAEIHNRMPAILTRQHEHIWLSEEINEDEALHIIKPYPPQNMMLYTVSNEVNKVSSNHRGLIEPIVIPPQPIQGRLFE